MKYEFKNSRQSKYSKDSFNVIKNLKIILVSIFALGFSLVGGLSTFADIYFFPMASSASLPLPPTAKREIPERSLSADI